MFGYLINEKRHTRINEKVCLISWIQFSAEICRIFLYTCFFSYCFFFWYSIKHVWKGHVIWVRVWIKETVQNISYYWYAIKNIIFVVFRWLDVKQCLIDTYQYAQHHGWYEVWKQIIDLSDPHGEQNAYKVLFFFVFFFMSVPPAHLNSISQWTPQSFRCIMSISDVKNTSYFCGIQLAFINSGHLMTFVLLTVFVTLLVRLQVIVMEIPSNYSVTITEFYAQFLLTGGK